MLKKVFIFFIIIASLLTYNNTNAFPIKLERYKAEPISEQEIAWVDSVMNTLSLRSKIAQLFMVAAYSNQGQKHIDNITSLVKNQHVGGLIFFQGSPTKQAELTNQYQKLSEVPLMIGMDAEWGVAMRLDSVIAFPKNMTLGAIQDNDLIYELGAEMARQCKLLGVHMNFAPSVDVNNNPDNSVINTRSFGENQYNVAQKGIALMRGLQDNGIIASAKHFPGHGDTNADSHHELPIIPYDRERLDSLELYPFIQMIENGIAGVMTGHLYISAIDTRDEIPASLSERVIRSLLKNELNFEGLTFTDALNMKGVLGKSEDHIAVAAIKAGNDILLMPSDITGGIDAIEKAIENEELTEGQIEIICRKILATKYRVGLNSYKPIDLKNITKKLTTTYSEVLYDRLMEAAITLVTNRENILPLKQLNEKSIAYLEIGKNKGKAFEDQLKLYADVHKVSLDKGSSTELRNAAKKQLAKYNVVIVGYHVTDARSARSFGVDTNTIDFIKDLSKDKKIIFVFFGTPYFLSKIELPQTIFDATIVAYDNTKSAQNRTAQAIFGGVPFAGKLPVGAEQFPAGYGIETHESTRFKYVRPEEIGITTAELKKIDSLVDVGIKQKAFPGCQVIAAYKGQVFYNKAIGSHTYDKGAAKVNINDIYDVASVTKVSATLPLVMKMVDDKQLKLNGKLKDYVTLHPKSTKGDILIKEILTHQAGLTAFIPFYLDMLTAPAGQDVYSNTKSAEYTIQIPGMKRFVHKNSALNKIYFSKTQSDTYNQHVASALYSSEKAKKYIYDVIDTSKVMNKNYRYSDLGFIYLQRVIESKYQKEEDFLADAFFYSPLGMNHTMYLPLEKVSKTRIPPTEKDDVYRRQLVHGYVHDQASAMLGGVTGHAGLFSNANDLAKLMQMYLNNGEYGGERYIDSTIVKSFTKYVNEKQCRRGLGFDKPETNPKKASPVCKEASRDSYGHSGFTGCLVWVDPQRDLVYVFLSNRIHPSTENSRITKLGTRTEILAHLLNTIDKLNKQQ